MENLNKTDIGLIGWAVSGRESCIEYGGQAGGFRFITVRFRGLKKVW